MRAARRIRSKARTRAAGALALGLLVLPGPAAGAQGAQEEGAPHEQDTPDSGARYALPAGPLAELVAALEQRAFAPVAPPPAWPAWDGVDGAAGAGWDDEAPWRDWVELLRAEAAARDDDPEHPLRRARLVLLAKIQGRDTDAWQHLLACGEHPITSTVLPALLPGVPLELLGSDAPLPAGVTLRPALPPQARGADGRPDPFAPRVMEDRDVRIGATRLTLSVSLEGDGVQIDAVWGAGPAADLAVLPPVPLGVDIGLLYGDWEKLAEERQVVPIRLEPDAERYTVWGRFARRAGPLSSAARAIPHGSRARSDFEIVVAPALVGNPRIARFAEALSELYDRPCTLRTPHQPGPSEVLEPIAIHFDTPESASGKLLGLMARIEAGLLEHGPNAADDEDASNR